MTDIQQKNLYSVDGGEEQSSFDLKKYIPFLS